MNKKVLSEVQLKKALDADALKEISADKKIMRLNMSSQFPDHNEWIREYVCNSFDAAAGFCIISGYEDGQYITIKVEDNGHGMNKKGVTDFFKLFRSVKKGDPTKTIGCHGVGKLSIASIPYQSGFFMQTSTGSECWQMSTGSILDDNPITIHRIEPVPEQGTVFKVTFKKKYSLETELLKLKQVLAKYCSYLPFDIIILGLTSDQIEGPNPINRIKKDWYHSPEETLPVSFQIDTDNLKYEVILSLSDGGHSVFHNRVLISTRYNLITHDTWKKVKLPFLSIRVDSPNFQSVFGRNRLTNESLLETISVSVRKRFVPNYFALIADKIKFGQLDDYDIDLAKIETIACKILLYSVDWVNAASDLLMFPTKNMNFLSFSALREQVRNNKVIYLEGSDSTGMDWSMFEEPVLTTKQPDGGIELITKHFRESLVVLDGKNLVIEAPPKYRNKLNAVEKQFQQHIGFHANAAKYKKRVSKSRHTPKNDHLNTLSTIFEKKGLLDRISRDVETARDQLQNIQFRLSHLVERDGKTPNKCHRFIAVGKTVILNLYHKEVQKLVSLSTHSPDLAGHLAVAMCLGESDSILSHLSADTREELLISDAIARCDGSDTPNADDKDVDKSAASPLEDERLLRQEINHTRLWL